METLNLNSKLSNSLGWRARAATHDGVSTRLGFDAVGMNPLVFDHAVTGFVAHATSRESLTVPGNHLPALLQPLLVALRMERFEDLGFELIVDFFRCLTQDVFESVLLATAALGFEGRPLRSLSALQDFHRSR